ncbi:DUF3592 domain-containing protein [Mangrovihabitans endophyticus]|uniref:DUF3592 domain-containing protein n=1 Tax=Mangrovihabitans endophyticus TaxID=1751298 RepID=A0A8J3FLQ5_9ACTN|nr:DUF3592 domain-containing protein [Mangrovihabitans endophyticus]GGK78821.1 hypothetical protein GCM10012284_10910 [Mangrovihabitans endophyticus]
MDGLLGVDVRRGRRRPGIVGSIFMIVAGLLFVWLGWYWHGQHEPYADGVTTTATVTRIVRSEGHDGKTHYGRIFTFRTYQGRNIRVTERERSSIRPELGAPLTVSYRPDDPEGARVVPENDWMPYGLMVWGCLFALIGLAVFTVRLIKLGFGVYLLGSADRQSGR